jgi:hypothetical protein
MAKTYTYKLQGNGSDSWEETDSVSGDKRFIYLGDNIPPTALKLITPPAITVNTHNYNPTGFNLCSELRQSTVGANQISGFQSPTIPVNPNVQPPFVKVRFKFINTTIASSNITIVANSVNSLVNNRIIASGNIIVGRDEVLWFDYDFISLGWRPDFN